MTGNDKHADDEDLEEYDYDISEIIMEDDSNPYKEMGIEELAKVLINTDGTNEQLSNMILFRIAQKGISNIYDAIVDNDISEYIGITKKIGKEQEGRRAQHDRTELVWYGALMGLWMYQTKNKINKCTETDDAWFKRYRIESLNDDVPYEYLYNSTRTTSLKDVIKEYGIDDVPSWCAERMHNYTNGIYDCSPGWLRVVLFDSQLTTLRSEGDKSAMTTAKKDKTNQAILESRKTKLRDKAMEQIEILQRYQITAEYDKKRMNNSWLIINDGKITVIPRIGGYPVSRKIEGNAVQVGGAGWECDDEEAAIAKIKGFVLKLTTTMYDEDIIRMFEPISRQQKRLDKNRMS